MTKVKIENHEELVRDVETQAVLNIDSSSLSQYRARRDQERKKAKELEHLKTEVSEIKELLYQLINRDDNR